MAVVAAVLARRPAEPADRPVEIAEAADPGGDCLQMARRLILRIDRDDEQAHLIVVEQGAILEQIGKRGLARFARGRTDKGEDQKAAPDGVDMEVGIVLRRRDKLGHRVARKKSARLALYFAHHALSDRVRKLSA